MPRPALPQNICLDYICDDELRPQIDKHSWYRSSTYPRATTEIGRVCMHTYVLYLCGYGITYNPDHIDRNPLNNKRSNLRFVNKSIQGFNRYVSKLSNLPVGVSFKEGLKKPYMARIRIKGKLNHLGYFETPEDASEAYQAALTEAMGG